MQAINLLENQKFNDMHANAEPLHVDKNGRAILFTLKPGQTIAEHNAPSSPFYAVILRGEGVFTGGDNLEQTFGPQTLLIFDPGEHHAITQVILAQASMISIPPIFPRRQKSNC